MYAQRWYLIKYTVPGDPVTREHSGAWFDPSVYLARFQRANPKAAIEGVYDRATGTKVI